MKWGEHRPFWKFMSERLELRGTRAECVSEIARALRMHPNPGVAVNTHAQLIIESDWIDNGRPYYDLYPSVIEAFCKVDLSKLKCSDLHLPLPQLLIRFPTDHNGPGSSSGPVQTVLVGEGNNLMNHYYGSNRGWLIMADEGGFMKEDDDIPAVTTTSFTMPDDETVEQRLEYGRRHGYCQDNIDNEMVSQVVQVVCTLCLLHGDPDLIEPEPLSADMRRWEQTLDPKLIDKAIRKGKRAWAVGRQIEIAPGFRRPHFAIRWTGKGGRIPKLTPIKGCIVNRRKLAEVPTGYLDELNCE